MIASGAGPKAADSAPRHRNPQRAIDRAQNAVPARAEGPSPEAAAKRLAVDGPIGQLVRSILTPGTPSQHGGMMPPVDDSRRIRPAACAIPTSNGVSRTREARLSSVSPWPTGSQNDHRAVGVYIPEQTWYSELTQFGLRWYRKTSRK